ncbi:MAG: hypothetical protein QM820_06235 [Minicystis sp.]
MSPSDGDDSPRAQGDSMRHRTLSLFALAASVAGCDSPSTTATAMQALSPCDQVAIDLVLDDLPLVWAENGGQATAAAYVGLGLTAGTVVAAENAIRLELADVHAGRDIAAATVALVHHAAAVPVLTAADGGTSTTTYHIGAAEPITVQNHDAIDAQGLYQDVDMRLSGTTRRLDATYTLAPHVPSSRVQWSYDGVTSVTTAPDGSLVLQAGDRQVSLGPPLAWQQVDGADVPLAAAYVVEDGLISIEVERAYAEQPLLMKTRLLHGAHAPVGIARTDGGEVMIAGRAYRAAGGDTGGDAMLARVSADGTRLLSATFVIGSGNDEALDLVRTPEDIVLVGRTGSPDLPRRSNGALAGASDGFVLALGDDGAKVRAGGYFGGDGDDAITGITQDDDGHLVVAGTTTSALEEIHPEAIDVTVSLPATDADAAAAAAASGSDGTYLVAELPANLARTDALLTFHGPRLRQLSVRRPCDIGPIHIGVVTVSTHSAVDCNAYPDLVSSMNHYGDDYSAEHSWSSPVPNAGSPPGGWAYHAMRWRYYEANAPLNAPPPVTPYTINWGALTAPLSTSLKYTPPMASQAAALDALEASPLFSPGDPPFGWVGGNSGTVEHLALLSAFYEYWYGTPVYMQKRYYGGLNGPFNHAAAVARVTFDVCVNTAGHSYTGQTLASLCNFTTGGWDNIACPGAIYGTSALGFNVVVKSFVLDTWNPLMIWYTPHMTHTAFPASNPWFVPTEWIANPPTAQAVSPALALDAADQLAEVVSAEIELVHTEYNHGTVASSAPTPAIVRARDLR